MSSTALGSRLNPPSPTRQERGAGLRAAVALGDTAACALLIALSGQLLPQANAAWPTIANFTPVPVTIGFLALLGSYRTPSVNWGREYTTLVTGTTLGFAAGAAIALFWGAREATAGQFVLAWLLSLLALLLLHLLRRSMAAKELAAKILPVAILGTSTCARSLYRRIENLERREGNAEPAVRVAAIFADGAEEWPEVRGREIVLGAPQWAKSFAECRGIPCAIVAIPAACDAATEELFAQSARTFKHLFAAPEIPRHETVLETRGAHGGGWTLHVGPAFDERQTGRLKRVLDVAGAIAFGLLSSPFVIVTAAAIWLSSKGPVLYKQVRVGKGNKAFTTLKFRTMYIDSGERLSEYLRKDPSLKEEWASVHKLKDDPRVTFIGRFLRRFSLDELPQLWNVLVGEMSLVGPRPIVVREIEKYGSKYAAYERARPGLTGLWQVSGRNNTSYQERVDYDAFYVRNWSLGLDARIIARTLRAVLSGAGAY
jgi:Undecaprenyl-phosphate galactose phosphotransferase WbaP